MTSRRTFLRGLLALPGLGCFVAACEPVPREHLAHHFYRITLPNSQAQDVEADYVFTGDCVYFYLHDQQIARACGTYSYVLVK